MILIFIVFLATVLAESYEKYIDLLPEEEKQEFLEQVARRVLENVESKENEHKFSRELTDDQLKEHNDFVQSVLKQESEQMRRSKESKKKLKENDSSEEHLNPLKHNKKADSTDDKQIVLTMVDTRRSYSDRDVETNDDDAATKNLPLQKRSVPLTEKSLTDTTSYEAVTEKIDTELTTDSNAVQPTTFDDESKASDETLPVKEDKDGVTNSDLSDSKINTENTLTTPRHGVAKVRDVTTTEQSYMYREIAVHNSDASTGSHVKSEVSTQANAVKDLSAPKKSNKMKTNVPNTESANIQSSSEDSDSEPKATDHVSKTSTLNPISNDSSENKQLTDNNPEDDSVSSTKSSTLSDKSTTVMKKINLTKTYKPAIKETNKETNVATSITEIPLANKTLIENTAARLDPSISSLTTEPLPVLTPVYKVESTTAKLNKIKLTLSKLKDKLKEPNMTKLPNRIKGCLFGPCVNYSIYEIPADQPPFIQMEDTVTEQLNYVPVYNYSPNNAYYTPQNLRGPNDIENNLGQNPTATLLRVGDNGKDIDPQNKFIIDLQVLMRKFGQYSDDKKYSILYHPKPFKKKKKPKTTTTPPPSPPQRVVNDNYPSSKEALHPYNNMKKGLKSHMMAIRNVLYHHQNFEEPYDECRDDYMQFLYGNKNVTPSEHPGKDENGHHEKDKNGQHGKHEDEDQGKKKNGLHGKDENEHHGKDENGKKSEGQGDNENKNEEEEEGTGGYKQNAYVKNVNNNYRPKCPKPRLRSGKSTEIEYDGEKFIKRSTDPKKWILVNLQSVEDDRHSNIKQQLKRTKETDGELRMFNFRDTGTDSENHILESKELYGSSEKRKDSFDKELGKNQHPAKHKKKGQVYNNNKDENDSPNNIYVKPNNSDGSKTNTIKDILKIVDTKDVFTVLDKLRKINISISRSSNDERFDIYMKTVKDMIERDDKALKQYDWLATTVEIRSALSKLVELIKRARELETLHPADVEILRYVIFLYTFATKTRQANHHDSMFWKKPPSRRHKLVDWRSEVLRKKGFSNLILLKKLLPDLSSGDELTDLYEFLFDVGDGLFDLHDAIKNIATVIKFKQQDWYKNIKDLYLTSEAKQIREVLLHISFTRLVGLIEFSCENGLEKDFVKYLKQNRDLAKKTLEEVMFVLKIVDEININSV